jgi:serine/threonine protein kinase/tetratricopeptide (TPR) repeat protein
MQSEPAIDEAARAILDGTAPDWTGLESSDNLETRALTQQLKILSAVAAVHRGDPAQTSGPADPERWGHLTILEKVGAGAYGSVYRAWDTRLDREVALKLLPTEAGSTSSASPIIEEGRLLAKVRHPNVATIYGAEMIDQRIGLWMEFVKGQTLEALLRSGHQFSVTDVARLVQLCHAVSAVHAAGLVHRDIKAQNVMRADDGRVVLMDFGTGRAQGDATMPAAGTPLYLAPEVFRNEPATPQSDIYAIGVLLYRLLSGAFPVNGKTTADLQRAHNSNERIDLQGVRPDLPLAIVRVVNRATDADPALRYDNCDSLAADLKPLAQRSMARRRVVLGLAAASVVIAAWIGWSGGNPLAKAAGLPIKPPSGPGIVVRPFRTLSTEPDSELLADRVTYGLINGLAIINGLDVKSATSSFTLQGKDLSLAEIGKKLGVTLVLEGSVVRAGDQLRVQAQLAEVGSDRPIWVKTFDKRVTDVLTVPDDIAREVVNHLRLAIGRGQRRYDLDQETLMLYVRAQALAETRDQEKARAAVPLFQQAIERDRSFAPAYAGLCMAYHFMSQNLPDVLGLPQQQALELMRAAAVKAIELDPMLAEAHAAMGLLHSRDFSRPDMWDAAERSFSRAIELNPAQTYFYTGYSTTTLMPQARFGEALALLQEALRRDPESLDVRRELALQQMTSGRYEEALVNLEHIRSVDPKSFALPLLMARTLSLSNRINEAMPYWESVEDIVGSQQWMAYAYVRNGRRDKIEQLASQPQEPYRMAIYQTALGNKDAAFAALNLAVDKTPHRTARLLRYPEMASLRDDPRFDAILARFHLKR